MLFGGPRLPHAAPVSAKYREIELILGAVDCVLAFDEAYTRRVSNHSAHHAAARLTEVAPCDRCRFAERCAVEHRACGI